MDLSNVRTLLLEEKTNDPLSKHVGEHYTDSKEYIQMWSPESLDLYNSTEKDHSLRNCYAKLN